MRILLVDDENLARERLKHMIQDIADKGDLPELGNIEIVGEASNGAQALVKIDHLKPECIILDIRMPGMDGIEVARHLMSMEDAPAIIFSTAYDEYAIEAFKVQALDYLLKPVRAERLKEALTRAVTPKKSQLLGFQAEENDGNPKARTHISSRTRKGIVLVPAGDVLYFKAEHKYVTVKHKEGEVLIEDTLKDLEQEFGDLFLRIHRNTLIAVDVLQGLEKNDLGNPCVKLRGVDELLEISRRHVSTVRKFMK